MSGRSSNNSQLLAAGLLGVGVGVLAAGVGYAVVNSKSPTVVRSLGIIRDAINDNIETQNVPAIEHQQNYEQNESQCLICGENAKKQLSLKLICRHLFHRKCLFSSYIVQTQMNGAATFICPVSSCKAAISNRVIESLIASH